RSRGRRAPARPTAGARGPRALRRCRRGGRRGGAGGASAGGRGAGSNAATPALFPALLPPLDERDDGVGDLALLDGADDLAALEEVGAPAPEAHAEVGAGRLAGTVDGAPHQRHVEVLRELL